jgi:phage gp16-like protein
MAKDVSAIHVLKAQLQLSDDDYRALLRQLTGKGSCGQMNERELAAVRTHMAGLAQRMGVGKPPARGRLSHEQFERSKGLALPKERKVWALWHQLGRDGLVTNTSPQALNAWVQRQVAVSALGFCTGPQLDTLIEGLKAWQERRTP